MSKNIVSNEMLLQACLDHDWKQTDFFIIRRCSNQRGSSNKEVYIKITKWYEQRQRSLHTNNKMKWAKVFFPMKFYCKNVLIVIESKLIVFSCFIVFHSIWLVNPRFLNYVWPLFNKRYVKVNAFYFFATVNNFNAGKEKSICIEFLVPSTISSKILENIPALRFSLK